MTTKKDQEEKSIRQYGGVLLQEGETLTKRVEAMPEKTRFVLQTIANERAKKVRDYMGRDCTPEELAVEMFYHGVFEGTNMAKRDVGVRNSGLIVPS